MAIQVLNLILTLFNSVFSWFFNLQITDGVSLGWIFMVVIIMFFLIRGFLKENDNG